MTSPALSETEARLLAAAGQIFAEHGFAAATVREICERAEANVAAVNYHFGDKLGLYRAVFRHAAACGMRDEDPAELSGSGESRLQAWIASFLGDLVAKDEAGWPGKLMARELADPSDVLSEYIEHGARPKFARLLEILGVIAPSLSADTQRRIAASIIGQIIFYHHARPFIDRLAPELALSPHAASAIAEHITAFSLAGIRALAPEIRA